MSTAAIALAPWGVQPNQGFVLSMSMFPRNQGKYNRGAAPWAVKPQKSSFLFMSKFLRNQGKYNRAAAPWAIPPQKDLFYSCQSSQATKVSVAKRYECCGHWNFGFKLRQCKR